MGSTPPELKFCNFSYYFIFGGNFGGVGSGWVCDGVLRGGIRDTIVTTFFSL